jgi:hypothetical protein
MPIDLNDLDTVRKRWLPLQGQLVGVEVLIKYASPRNQEQFRQKLARSGVLKSGKGAGWEINTGREDDFFRMFAQFYILDWKGDIRPEGTEYSPEAMGRVLGSYQPAFDQVSSAVSEDADFFEQKSDE